MLITIEELSHRRKIHDRRRRPTPMISRYTFFGGRRKTIRRAEDREVYKYVDLYSIRLVALLLILLLFNYADAYFTIFLVEEGSAIEINPVMAFFLNKGVLSFILAKFFITVVTFPILCLFKNTYIARFGLFLVIMSYFSIIIYELYFTLFPTGTTV